MDKFYMSLPATDVIKVSEDEYSKLKIGSILDASINILGKNIPAKFEVSGRVIGNDFYGLYVNYIVA